MIKKYFSEHSLKSLIMITLGAILSAFSIEEFLVPSKLFDGGITGVSMILSHYLHVELGVLIILINIPFMVLAFYKMNHVFVFKMLYAIALMSAATVVLQPMHEVTDEVLLAITYGGIILGIGVGLVLKGGGCLDGTEVVAVVLSKTTVLSTGQVILIFNVIIFLIAGGLFNMDRGLHSLLMYFITSKVIDVVDVGFDSAKSVMIITDEYEELANAIYNKLGRTVTFIPGKGYVSGSVKYVLYCVITRTEIHDLKEILRDFPGSTFSTISDVSDIIGHHVKKN